MNRLIIETSTAQASVALFSENQLLVEESFPGGRGPVSRFFAVLRKTIRLVPKVDAIVVGVGPGSYSGIRIGIAAAIGLRLAGGIVAGGIHSALGYEGDDYQVVLDARGSWVYLAVRGGRLHEGPVHCRREELEGKLDRRLPVYGPEQIPGLSLEAAFPTAGMLGRRLENGAVADLPLLPLYLKAPHITVARVISK